MIPVLKIHLPLSSIQSSSSSCATPLWRFMKGTSQNNQQPRCVFREGSKGKNRWALYSSLWMVRNKTTNQEKNNLGLPFASNQGFVVCSFQNPKVQGCTKILKNSGLICCTVPMLPKFAKTLALLALLQR